MPSTYWPEFLTLAAIVVVSIAAALQAGDPRAWSWRRFFATALALGVLLTSAIWAGLTLVTELGPHYAMLATCGAAATIAVTTSLVATFRHRRTRGE